MRHWGPLVDAREHDARQKLSASIRRQLSFKRRNQITDPRVTIELGDAQNLPYADASFDRCLALLIVNFIPDAAKAAKEMRRVTKSGGVVATTMWDCSSANELQNCLWDAAIAIDPTLK